MLPKGDPRDAGLFVHISAGIAILALLVARVISRMVDPSPQPEATEFGAWMGKWLDLLPGSRTLPFMRCCSQSRSLGSYCSLRVVMRFRYLVWPKFHRNGHNVKKVHEILAHALVIFAAFHAAAALIHHLIFRDRTLVRMLPQSEK